MSVAGGMSKISIRDSSATVTRRFDSLDYARVGCRFATLPLLVPRFRHRKWRTGAAERRPAVSAIARGFLLFRVSTGVGGIGFLQAFVVVNTRCVDTVPFPNILEFLLRVR